MLPANFKYQLFDRLSVKTMRYVSAVPTSEATGLTKQVYDMIQEDFFKNGSLTSRSKVPEIMAAIWIAGRESMIVEDKVDRTTKDAICAVLSQINDCSYCEDMLISLVHAGGKHAAAKDIFAQTNLETTDSELQKILDWLRAVADPDSDVIPPSPFSELQLPEVLGTLLAMSDINRFSHVVMEDSPVNAPFGLQSVKATALRMFGSELETTRWVPLEHGRSLALLPSAELPDDMAWAKANSRVADAVARYAATIEHESRELISSAVRNSVSESLKNWQGEQAPISRSWVEPDLVGLSGNEAAIARLAIVLAKAPYQVDEKMVEAVLDDAQDECQFIRILAWASFVGARRFVQLIADRSIPTTIKDFSKTGKSSRLYTLDRVALTGHGVGADT